MILEWDQGKLQIFGDRKICVNIYYGRRFVETNWGAGNDGKDSATVAGEHDHCLAADCLVDVRPKWILSFAKEEISDVDIQLDY